MEINETVVLDKTHYGIKIFAHILKQHYPGKVVLYIKGRKCRPTNNPFNNHRSTLLVTIEGRRAVYKDLEKEAFKGDVFDFAKLHYKLEGIVLLEKINQELHLNIGKDFYRKSIIETHYIENEFRYKPPIVSYFSKPISNIWPKKHVDIYDLYNEIKGTRFITCTEELRKISDKRQARNFKSLNFDYVTFSGTFTRRNDKDLVQHSGLMVIDFDHVSDLDILRNALISDSNIETHMLFTSPSGHGLKWIIKVDLSKLSHQDYFRAVANYIRCSYNLEIDQSGKDISRACFLSYDPKVYLNPNYH